MAYDIKSDTILRGATGNQGDYAAVTINDRFSDLDKKDGFQDWSRAVRKVCRIDQV